MQNLQYFHQPSVSESLGNGWYTMKKFFLYLFLAVFISGIFDGGMNGSRYELHPGQSFPTNWTQLQPFLGWFTPTLIVAGLILAALFFLIRSVLSYGADLMFIQAVRDEKPEIKNLFIGFMNRYVPIVLSNLLVILLTIAGFVALIIPGIIIACRLAFVSYLVMDKKMDAFEAIETSWKITRGHGLTIFGLAILSGFIFIGGLLLLIVGVFPALIWIKSSFASLYQAILTQRSGQVRYTDSTTLIVEDNLN